MTPAHAEAARAAGVSDEALADAVYVCALFNMIDRVADALGFAVLPPEQFAARAPDFLAGGYRSRIDSGPSTHEGVAGQWQG